MSLGSDFAAGMNVGLDTRRNSSVSFPNINPYGWLENQADNQLKRHMVSVEASQPTILNRGGGPRKSAKQILEDARIETLIRKEKELNIAAQEIENKAAEQKVNQDRLKFLDERTKAAQNTAQGLRTDRVQTESNSFETGKQAAIRGFYNRDSDAVLNFINNNGSPNANARAVDFDDPEGKGRVFIDYGDDGVVAYNSPQDAIEKTIIPMTVIEQGIKGRMSDYQRAQIENNKQEILDKSSKAWGEQNTKAKQAEANSNNKIYEKYVNDVEKYNMENDDQIPIMSRDEYFASRGLNTGAPNRAGKDQQSAKVSSQGLDTSGSSENLPEGLDEETIQYNMKKYGKTRQEVIDKYNSSRGR